VTATESLFLSSAHCNNDRNAGDGVKAPMRAALDVEVDPLDERGNEAPPLFRRGLPPTSQILPQCRDVAEQLKVDIPMFVAHATG
jgi:hypothetical protein